MDSNKKKADLLGMPYGTATSRLRKILLYEFAKELELLNCYRCGEEILSIEEFSIEHKIAWMSTISPKDSFFNISNIAFSHLLCNTLAGARPHKKWTDKQEKHREKAKRRYADPERREKFLDYKRQWYAKNKLT